MIPQSPTQPGSGQRVSGDVPAQTPLSDMPMANPPGAPAGGSQTIASGNQGTGTSEEMMKQMKPVEVSSQG